MPIAAASIRVVSRRAFRSHARLIFVVFAALFSLGACSRNDPTAPVVQQTPDATLTDEQLRAIAYDPGTRPDPPGFYRENLPEGSALPYYVNTVSVGSNFERWTELSTDDVSQARAWAEATVASPNQIPPLDPGPPRVTERYIEFASSVGPPYGVAIRVHRVSYLDRSMVDRWRPDSIVGVFTSRSIEFLPVRGPTVKGLAEYLWVKDEQFPKVLASFSYDGGDVVVHAIYDLVLVWGDWGMGDRIFMRRLEYRVNKRTGLIVLRAHVVREIAGRGPTSTAARPLPEEARPLHLSQTLGQRLARRAQSR